MTDDQSNSVVWAPSLLEELQRLAALPPGHGTGGKLLISQKRNLLEFFLEAMDAAPWREL